MAKDVIMPVLGMNQDSGVLVRWFVEDGKPVIEGEPLIEVETDKAVVEVPAMASGMLANLTASEGDEVPTGTVIAVLLDDQEAKGYVPGASQPEVATSVSEQSPVPSEPVVEETTAPPATPIVEPSVGPGTAEGSGASEPPTSQQPTSPVVGSGELTTGAPPATDGIVRSDGLPLSTPKARRLANELGVDLWSISGRGPGGAVRATDLVAALTGGGCVATEQRPEVSTGPTVVTSSADLARSRSAQASGSVVDTPMWLRREIELAPLSEMVARANDYLTRTGSDVEVTLCDLAAHITIAALAAEGKQQQPQIGITRLTAQDRQVFVSESSKHGSLVDLARQRSRSGSNDTRSGADAVVGDSTDPTEARVQLLDYLDLPFESSLPALPAHCELRVALTTLVSPPRSAAMLTVEYRTTNVADPARLMTRLCQLFDDPIGVLLFV